MTPDESTRPPPRGAGKDRGFIGDQPLRRVVREGQHGVLIKVRLTSYRSLPLSCIEAMHLKIDGAGIDSDQLVLTVNQVEYRVTELAGLSRVWWFILDYAELFAPTRAALAPGEHDVEGTLVTVEPYMTAGRFSFHNTSRKRLPLEAAVEVSR